MRPAFAPEELAEVGVGPHTEACGDELGTPEIAPNDCDELGIGLAGVRGGVVDPDEAGPGDGHPQGHPRRARRDLAEGGDQSIDLFGRVVVGQPDPQDAAGLEQAEPLDQGLGVEVAVPGGDPLPPERLGRGPRRSPSNVTAAVGVRSVEPGPIA